MIGCCLAQLEGSRKRILTCNRAGRDRIAFDQLKRSQFITRHRQATAGTQRQKDGAINDGLAAIAARGQAPGMPQCFAPTFG
jgi:hypothetical protein